MTYVRYDFRSFWRWKSVQLLNPPPAEGLNFHLKQSKIQSHDYKFKIIAVKVIHLWKVKSTKFSKNLNLWKNGVYCCNQNYTWFQIKHKLQGNSKMSKLRKLVGKSPLVKKSVKSHNKVNYEVKFNTPSKSSVCVITDRNSQHHGHGHKLWLITYDSLPWKTQLYHMRCWIHGKSPVLLSSLALLY